MDMTYFARRSWHEPLARLGRVDWVRFRPFDDAVTGEGHMYVDLNARAVADVVGETAARQIFRAMNGDFDRPGEVDPQDAMMMASLTRCFAEGPKVIDLDRATCEALAHTKIHVEVADYAPPFESLIFRFSPEWAREVDLDPACQYTTLLLTKFSDPDILASSLLGGGDGQRRKSLTFYVTHRAGMTVEDALHAAKVNSATAAFGTPEEFEARRRAVSRFHRVALNVGLLATYAGVKGIGWLDPNAHATHERLARRGDPRGKELLAGDIEHYAFDRDVHLVLGIDVRARGEYQGGTHRSPHPGWRKQHWRMMGVGPGRARRELRIVRRAFVRARALPEGVRPEDVPATYTAELPPPERPGIPMPPPPPPPPPPKNVRRARRRRRG